MPDHWLASGGEPAGSYRQVDGDVDQSAGMLSEDVKEKGYALLCVSYPRSDCTIQTIEEARPDADPVAQRGVAALVHPTAAARVLQQDFVHFRKLGQRKSVSRIGSVVLVEVGSAARR